MGIWVPWRMGGPTEQARARRSGGRQTRGQVSDKRAIAQARAKHRRAALAKLRKGKITPAQYQKELKRIG